jgi:hypothetical protein
MEWRRKDGKCCYNIEKRRSNKNGQKYAKKKSEDQKIGVQKTNGDDEGNQEEKKKEAETEGGDGLAVLISRRAWAELWGRKGS